MKRYSFAVILYTMYLMSFTNFQIDDKSLQVQSNSLCPSGSEEVDFDRDDDLEGEINEFNEVTGKLGVTTGIRISNTTPLGSGTLQIDDPSLPTTVKLGVIYNSLSNRPTGLLPSNFIVLLNEKPLILNSNHDIFSEIVLTPGKFELLSFDLPQLQPGLYDLIIIGVLGSNLPPLPDLQEAGRVSENISRRVTLIVGDPSDITSVQHPYTLLPALGEWENIDDVDQITPISVIPSLKDSQLWWSLPNSGAVNLKPSEPLLFNLRTRYEYYNVEESVFASPDYFVFAYMMFLDYKPYNITEDKTVYYAKVTQSTALAASSFTLTTPESPGQYDLVIVQIAYPGVPQCFIQEFKFDTVEVIPLIINIEE